MLKLLSNHKEWIQPEWIEWLMTHDGRQLPKDSFEENKLDEECGDMGEKTDWFTKWGYKPEMVFCDQYKEDIFPYKLEFPFIPEKIKKWTILRYTPGQFLPLHSDDVRFENERRLWMPLTDYEPGHITVHDETLIKDYQAGDLFHFTNPDAVHGVANIGKSIRLLLSIVVFDEDTQWNR
jgi:hypothetical protein